MVDVDVDDHLSTLCKHLVEQQKSLEWLMRHPGLVDKQKQLLCDANHQLAQVVTVVAGVRHHIWTTTALP